MLGNSESSVNGWRNHTSVTDVQQTNTNTRAINVESSAFEFKVVIGKLKT